MESSCIVLVSTYTDDTILAHTPKGEKGAGIYAFMLDQAGSLTPLNTLEVGPNVAFLVKHPMKNIIYATTECIDKNGEILTLALLPNGKLEVLDRMDALGRSTCFINIHENCRFLTIVNYWDAKVCTFSLSDEGIITGACDIDTMPGAEYVQEKNPDRVEHWKYRQRWPHTHCAVTAPRTAGRIFVCDLGRDKVLHYDLEDTGKLRPTGDVQLDRQIGPRGIEFHPHLPVAYITNELTSTVSVVKINPARVAQSLTTPTFDDVHDENSFLHEVQRLSTLPEDWQDKYFTNEHGIWKAASHSSEIRLHPSGHFLFIGNRGHDSIVCYRVDPTAGTLALAAICPSGGKCPRNFNFDTTGQWLVVGNQDSNVLSVFKINQETGKLTFQSEVPCPSVNYVYSIPV